MPAPHALIALIAVPSLPPSPVTGAGPPSLPAARDPPSPRATPHEPLATHPQKVYTIRVSLATQPFDARRPDYPCSHLAPVNLPPRSIPRSPCPAPANPARPTTSPSPPAHSRHSSLLAPSSPGTPAPSAWTRQQPPLRPLPATPVSPAPRAHSPRPPTSPTPVPLPFCSLPIALNSLLPPRPAAPPALLANSRIHPRHAPTPTPPKKAPRITSRVFWKKLLMRARPPLPPHQPPTPRPCEILHPQPPTPPIIE